MKHGVIKTIAYSKLTKGSCDIICPFLDDEKEILFKKYKYSSGVVIGPSSYYSVCSGVVIDIQSVDSLFYVTIQHDSSNLIRYNKLNVCNLKLGQVVHFGDEVGSSSLLCRFEYANLDPSIFPLRLNLVTYWKHDPMPILTGDLTINTISTPRLMKPNPTQEIEFTNGRGE